MFQFPRFPFYAYIFSIKLFGDPRIKDCMRLPGAYRS